MVLIAPREVPLRDKVLFRENKVQNDYENITENTINFLFVKFLKDNLGIASLAAYLREYGYTVTLFNSYLSHIATDELCERIIAENPKIVGISLLYDLHLYNTCEIVKQLRKKGYRGHITLGGPFISLTYEYVLRGLGEVDSVIRGEGEMILLELINRLTNGKEWKTIDGIAYKENDTVIVNKAGMYEKDLSRLPKVARDMYEELFGMLKKKNANTKVASIYTSRGCKGKCTYCSAPKLGELTQEKWRCRSVESIVEEIKYLVDTFGVEYINIIDENFYGYGEEGKKRLYEFANTIISENIQVKFWAEIRVDVKFEDELFCLLKKAGLQDVLLGLESGAQTALNRWKKGTTIEQNIKAINYIRKMGFELEPSFIMVDPYTDVKEFKETVNFIETMEIYNTRYPLNLINQLIVFPGTEIEKQLVRDNIIDKIDQDKITQISDNDEDIFEFCQKTSSRNYEIVDPIIRSFWNILVSYTNKIAFFTDDFIMTYIRFCKDNFQNSKGNYYKKVLHEFIVKAGKWRRNLGNLVMALLKETIECTDAEYDSIEELEERLHGQIRKRIHQYSNQHLGQDINDFMNNYISRVDFNCYINNDFSDYF